jgi:citrate synthase
MTRGTVDDVSAWWSTAIVDVAPGRIRVRGYPIEQLVGGVGFPAMIWLMLRGELPSPDQAALLEAALVSAVDHGPHAPSIAIARMATSCGVGLNGAMASAINVLDDVHGGAGEQCMALYADAAARLDAGATLDEAAAAALAEHVAARGKRVPGFGHRFHPIDPRAVRLLALVDAAAARGVVTGRFAAIGRAVEALVECDARRKVPMNIDGATAVVFSELGFAPPLGRGLFVLSRSVGILAHAWEQSGRGERIKGPIPTTVPYRYTGVPERPLVPGGPADD